MADDAGAKRPGNFAGFICGAVVHNDYLDIIVRVSAQTFELVKKDIVARIKRDARSGDSFRPVVTRKWLLNSYRSN